MTVRRARATLLERDDRGTALVEFFWLGILLLVPITYAILFAFDVQRAAFAVTEATRSAGRAFVTAGGGDARARAHAAGDKTVLDHLHVHLSATNEFQCEPATSCNGGEMTFDPPTYDEAVAQGAVTVTVVVKVPLPGLGGITGPPLQVTGSHREVFDTFADYSGAAP
ncbi:MAG: hypothetical protein JWM93_499 [Frankiales bacterium]|nr:hypothetical protein [Frankiales bacterium]